MDRSRNARDIALGALLLGGTADYLLRSLLWGANVWAGTVLLVAVFLILKAAPS